jgi:hypothetical protein
MRVALQKPPPGTDRLEPGLSAGSPQDARDPFVAPKLADELAAYLPLLRRLDEGSPVVEDASTLIDEALAVWARPGFDTFMCLARLRFEPFPYQLETAARVLRQMQGRAILADEVGLGKTIEAGLVLSELRLRGLAPRVLVLVPAGLVGQWREELEVKFGLPALIAKTGLRGFDSTLEDGIVLSSLAAARRAPLCDALTESSWDLVIIDEAHRLKTSGARRPASRTNSARATCCCSQPRRSRTASRTCSPLSASCARARLAARATSARHTRPAAPVNWLATLSSCSARSAT